MIKGYDVAHYQRGRRLDGAAFVIAKATEGLTYEDPTHGDWRREAARVGAVFGSYHFAHPDQSAEAEARHFLAVAKPRPGELVALDLEVSDGQSAGHVAAYARTWLDYVAERTAAAPLLYSYRSFIAAGNCAGCGAYPLWIADPGRPVGQPRVPSPWDHWTIHQYSTAGDIDHDVANVHDIAQLRKLAVPGSRTPPKPKPAPVPDDWMETIMTRLPTLKRGDRDQAGHVQYVRRLQGLLCALGPDIAIDGDFGPVTEGRVMEEQRQYGIAVDGIVGPVTWSYLITGSAP